MILSIISTLIAVVSAFIALNAVNEQRRISKYQINIQLLYETEQQLKNNPELLGLHGVEVNQLREIGITAEEFMYILNSFRAGNAYAYINDNEKDPLSEYRKNFLDNPKVKLTWERIIKLKFLNNTAFTKAIDEYYKK